MKIEKLIQTCSASPSQWEGITEDGKPVYIHYGWGHLSVCIGPKGGDVMSAIEGEEIYGKQVGDKFDGRIDRRQVAGLAGLEAS